MDDRLRDLYTLPSCALPQDAYLLEISEHCARLEERLRSVAAKLNEQDRLIVESYIDMRDELEFQSVKAALKFGKLQK